MLCGAADRLTSRFHLSYNMLLNCVRVETADIEMLIQKSFYTFQLQQARPDLEKRQRELLALLSSADLAVPNESRVVELNALLVQERVLRAQLRPHVTRPSASVQFLQPGRLAQFGVPSNKATSLRDLQEGKSEDTAEWGWGVIISFKRHEARSGKSGKSDPLGDASEYEVDVLLRCEPDALQAVDRGGSPEPARDSDNAEPHVVTLGLAEMESLSSVRVSLPKDLRSADGRYSVLKVLREVERRFPDGMPQLHPLEDLKIEKDKEAVAKLLRKLESVQVRSMYDVMELSLGP